VMNHPEDAPRLRTMLVCAIQGVPFPMPDDDTPAAPLETGIPDDPG
jgi:hypothetical protein